MKAKGLFTLVALLTVWSIQPIFAGDNPNPYCASMGGFQEAVCMPSLSVLMARREEFDNKLVIVTGYFAYADVPILFTNSDAFMNSDTANGLVISRPKDIATERKLLIGLNHRYVTILGRFKARPVELSEHGAYFSGGSLVDISEVKEAVNPWGEYSSPPPEPKKN